MRRQNADALTPREREVLDLIRLGLTNEEIAGHLGITLDGAKYHVSQILSKLGVATREEAVAVALGEWRPWWARWPLVAKIAGAAMVVAAAVAGLALLASTYFNGRNSEEAAASIPSLTRSEPGEVSSEECQPIGGTASYLEGLGLGWLAPGVLCWVDSAGESGYLVQGSMVYWRCDTDGYAGQSGSIPLTERLAQNVTSYRLPDSPEPSFDRRSFSVLVSAIGQDEGIQVADSLEESGDPCAVFPFESSRIGSYDDPYDFRSFATLLDAALRTGDAQFFLDNITYWNVCEASLMGHPEGCADGPVMGTVIGVKQSEGHWTDPAGYERFVRGMLSDFNAEVTDQYGEGQPQLYGYGIVTPGIPQQTNGPIQLRAVASSISAAPPQGQSGYRKIVEFYINYDEQRWVIDSLSWGTDPTILPLYMDPAGAGAQLDYGFPRWAFWQRWEPEPTPTP